MSARGENRRLPLLLGGLALAAALVWWDHFDAASPLSIWPADDPMQAPVLPSGVSRDASANDEPMGLASGGDHRVQRAPLGGIKLGELTETTARPLFSQSRRPPEKPVPVAAPRVAPPPPDLSKFRLLGVLSTGRNRIALIGRQGRDDVIRAVVDQVIEGWQITAIEPRRIRLKYGENQAELPLFKGSVANVRRGGPASQAGPSAPGAGDDAPVLYDIPEGGMLIPPPDVMSPDPKFLERLQNAAPAFGATASPDLSGEHSAGPDLPRP